MKHIVIALLLCCSANAHAEQQPPQARFATIDVYVDSGDKALAAWQFELSDRRSHIQVVGIESGEHAAFDDPPHYDREAVAQGMADRIAVADFSLAGAAELPKGETRIATVHLRIEGESQPAYDIQLIAAGDAEGRPIPAQISIRKQ